MDHSPGPPFTLDDLLAFRFLLMDDTYIRSFSESVPRSRHGREGIRLRSFVGVGREGYIGYRA